MTKPSTVAAAMRAATETTNGAETPVLPQGPDAVFPSTSTRTSGDGSGLPQRCATPASRAWPSKPWNASSARRSSTQYNG